MGETPPEADNGVKKPKASEGVSVNGPTDFDGAVFEIERQIKDLEALSRKHGVDFAENIATLRKQQDQILRALVANLSPWDRICMARHRDRPTASDYISQIFSSFIELHGDRAFADDRAIITGLGTVDGHPVMIVANEKGRGVKEKGKRNFGMAHPEGYRKARLKMLLAEKLGLPVVTFIDTQGAFPGIGAEQRGQALAIAENLKTMASLRTPILALIIGEGGSGGALAIGVADRVCAQENSYFSVITPEGCSAILWKSADKRREAAEALKLDPRSLMTQGIVDEIIPEPLGGAHRDPRRASEILKAAILRNLAELRMTGLEELLRARYYRYRRIGSVVEGV
ncbi:MAG: acetyl-CoA carboxylase carboxyltransferase subunit alpha [Planctomycetes bacterium]|nr:acetyl-CoA carboxylase carboxyltransferase subunit alpha [Planctomycetota bacterium]